MRTVALVVIGLTSLAHAQPLDPYAAPTPPPGVDDPAMAEEIAAALVARARELFEARALVDAKQLAVEALVKSPNGVSAAQAKGMIRAINKELGLDDQGRPVGPPPGLDAQVDKTPMDVEPPPIVSPPTPEGEDPSRRTTTLRVHGALFGGIVGAAVGALVADDRPASGAVPAGLAGGVAGALLAPRLVGPKGSEAQVRTVGSLSVWTGLAGAFFADAVVVDDSSARGVLVGGALGSTAGALVGYGLARKDGLTRGDVALVDTLAGVGAAGGLTLGMLMQPAKGEAYSVNAIVGTTGGVVLGLLAAPKTNTTTRRMMRVAGAAALGGGAPFLLYAASRDPDSTDDERLTGVLSTIGLVGGLVLGFRLTRDLDVGLDTKDGRRVEDDAPAALVGRHSDGRWTLGALAVTPLSPTLSSQPGMSVPVLGATF